MALQSDLSRSPYYDDFNSNNNFYRVLYRPGTAVQTRELNQMQSILQDQIDKFGRHIFTEGSVVEGCSFTFDKNYNYVKINDNYTNNFAISSITDFLGKYVYNNQGLKAYVVNVLPGFQSNDPDLNTLYVKYLNVGNYANGDNQTVFANNETLSVVTLSAASNSSSNATIYTTSGPIGNVSVATVTNSTGQGYAFTTTPGVIFQKGVFTSVPQQTLIVSHYDNNPDNISVGFNSIESIVTPEADTNLLDNAAGAPNYAAPGAHRLKIVPTLYTISTSANGVASDSFFSLVDFKNGVPVSIRNTPEYNILGKQLAKTTYETNGNFIINPFLLSTEQKAITDPLHLDNVNLISSSGLGYVEGYRVEFINNSKVTLRKGTDTETISAQIVSANYGNYVLINEYIGDFDTEHLVQVELHKGTNILDSASPPNVIRSDGMKAVSNLTFLNSNYVSARKIGTAYVKAIAYDSGRVGSGQDQYRLYLFNIKMSPGQNFADVRNIIKYSGSSMQAVADTVLTSTPNFLIKFNTVLVNPMLDTMIFPLGQSAIKKINNMQFVYRNQDTTSAAAIQSSGTGVMTLSIPSPHGSATEHFDKNGTLSPSEIKNILVIPNSTGTTADKNGLISVISPNFTNVVVTSGTGSLATDYNIGDFIQINGGEIHYITFIANNTQLTIREAASAVSDVTHRKAFVKGVPIDYTSGTRTVVVSNDTMTLTLNENLTSQLQTTVYYDVLRSKESSIKKNINRNVYVKICTLC